MTKKLDKEDIPVSITERELAQIRDAGISITIKEMVLEGGLTIPVGNRYVKASNSITIGMGIDPTDTDSEVKYNRIVDTFTNLVRENLRKELSVYNGIVSIE